LQYLSDWERQTHRHGGFLGNLIQIKELIYEELNTYVCLLSIISIDESSVFLIFNRIQYEYLSEMIIDLSKIASIYLYYEKKEGIWPLDNIHIWVCKITLNICSISLNEVLKYRWAWWRSKDFDLREAELHITFLKSVESSASFYEQFLRSVPLFALLNSIYLVVVHRVGRTIESLYDINKYLSKIVWV
jgi:hypothetical protein